MRMQGGKTGDVCDAAMPQTRRVCGRFWFSPPPAGGGGALCHGSVGRSAAGMAVGSCGKRGKRARARSECDGPGAAGGWERGRPSHPSHTNHLEGKGGLGKWVPDARGVTAPSGGGPPSPTRVVRVVQGAMAHHRAQPPKLLVRDAPLPSGRRLPRLLQLPVVGLHLLVPAQHPPRQEVGGLLQRGPHGAPTTH